MSIREYNKEDMDLIIHIWLEASIQAHSFISPDYWVSKVGDMRKLYIPNSTTYVYTEDNNVLGFISLIDNCIVALFVSPNLQGRGIGRKLIGYVKNIQDSLRLGVYAKNTNAILFYQKQGFTILEDRMEKHTGCKEFVMVYNKK